MKKWIEYAFSYSFSLSLVLLYIQCLILLHIFIFICFYLWKTLFQSVTHEMTLHAAEQKDFLIKHLGPESKTYAKDLYAAHPSNSVMNHITNVNR